MVDTEYQPGLVGGIDRVGKRTSHPRRFDRGKWLLLRMTEQIRQIAAACPVRDNNPEDPLTGSDPVPETQYVENPGHPAVRALARVCRPVQPIGSAAV